MDTESFKIGMKIDSGADINLISTIGLEKMQIPTRTESLIECSGEVVWIWPGQFNNIEVIHTRRKRGQMAGPGTVTKGPH